MDDTWGVSGPQFLVGYNCLLALAAYVAWVRPIREADALAWPWQPLPPTPNPGYYGTFSRAFLLGGPARVATVAVATYLLDGLVHVDSKGRLSATAGARTPQDGHGGDTLALEWSALADIESLRHRKLGGIAKSYAGLAQVKAIDDRLRGDGLLVRPFDRDRVNWGAWLLGILFVLGILCIVFGLAHDKPVQLMVMEYIFVWPFLLVASFTPRSDWTCRTRSGQALVQELRSRSRGTVGPAAVAVLGLGALGDAKLAKFLGKGGKDSGSGGCGGGSVCEGACGAGCGG